MMKPRYAYVTVLLGGSGRYLPGVIALQRSLRASGAKYPLMVGTAFCSDDVISVLDELSILHFDLFEINPPSCVRELNNAGEFCRWNQSFTKLGILGITHLDKVVLLDSDMAILSNLDSLFDCKSMSAVIAGKGFHPEWVDLNSGLMVIEPSTELFGRAMNILNNVTPNDLIGKTGLGDQDILKLLIRDWPTNNSLHLGEEYNAFQDALSHYDRTGYLRYGLVKVVHFELGPRKPWEYKLSDWFGVVRRCVRFGSFAEIKALMFYRRLLPSRYFVHGCCGIHD